MSGEGLGEGNYAEISPFVGVGDDDGLSMTFKFSDGTYTFAELLDRRYVSEIDGTPYTLGLRENAEVGGLEPVTAPVYPRRSISVVVVADRWLGVV